MDIKIIPRPALKKARLLSAGQLNGYHFADKHTRLTPEQLAAMAAARNN